MINWLHNILYIFFLVVLSIPAFISLFGIEFKPLQGAFQQIERKKISMSSFLDGSYQAHLESEEKSLNNIAPTLIRLRNQVDFDAFDIGHMGDGLIGKNGYVFGKSWASSYIGNRLYSDEYFDSITSQLKEINRLYDSLGKAFLVVIPPCKEGLFSDQLPEGYEKNDTNDYESYVKLECHENQLTSLDVSQNTILTFLNCSSNQLICLNGNNANFIFFSANFNSNLTCIGVDNVSYSNSNWLNIDTGVTFSTNCPNSCALEINEIGLSNLSIYPNPVSNVLYIETKGVDNAQVSIFNINGKLVHHEKDLKVKGSINISHLPNGMYLVSVFNKGFRSTRKFTKE